MDLEQAGGRAPHPPPLTIEEAIAALASAEPGAASAFSEPIAPEMKQAIGEGRSDPAPLGSCGASQAPRTPVSRRGEARQRERRPAENAHQPPVCVPEGSEVPFPWVEAFAYVLCLIGDLATKPVETWRELAPTISLRRMNIAVESVPTGLSSPTWGVSSKKISTSPNTLIPSTIP